MTDVTNHEPTIDEMLLWLNDAHNAYRECHGTPCATLMSAICAILERHADGYFERKAIRAFVERVEDRWKNCRGDNLLSYTPFQDAMQEELAAMEKEQVA